MDDLINGIPRRFYNSLKYPDSWEYKPNGDMRQCQCTMSHRTFIDGEIPQCNGARNPGSDLYCEHCEQDHGKGYIARLAEQERRQNESSAD